MYNRKIYFTGSASGNNQANVLVPSKGTLIGVQWAVDYDSITDGASVTLELSRASTNEVAINEAQQSISEVRWFSNFVTSGLAQFSVNLFVPTSVPFMQGQLIYLHSIVGGTVVFRGGAILWLR